MSAGAASGVLSLAATDPCNTHGRWASLRSTRRRRHEVAVLQSNSSRPPWCRLCGGFRCCQRLPAGFSAVPSTRCVTTHIGPDVRAGRGRLGAPSLLANKPASTGLAPRRGREFACLHVVSSGAYECRCDLSCSSGRHDPSEAGRLGTPIPPLAPRTEREGVIDAVEGLPDCCEDGAKSIACRSACAFVDRPATNAIVRLEDSTDQVTSSVGLTRDSGHPARLVLGLEANARHAGPEASLRVRRASGNRGHVARRFVFPGSPPLPPRSRASGCRPRLRHR